MRLDWHQYRESFDCAIRLIEKAQIDENDRRRILDFKDRLVVEGISKPRIIKYLHNLKMLSVWMQSGFRNAQEPMTCGKHLPSVSRMQKPG